MTEKDKLHIVKQIGAIMDASEPEIKDDQASGITINVTSPDNRVAGRDYIEVNIHLGGAGVRRDVGPQISPSPKSESNER